LAHSGRPAGDLSITLDAHASLGLVVHDGTCAYAPSGRLGCYDPNDADRDLGCADPRVNADGSYWLFLHSAAHAPFSGGAPRFTDLPLWAYDHVRDDDTEAVYIWGMSKEDLTTQELWRWDPTRGDAIRVHRGPAAMSGGIARWPGASGCLALTTYEPGGDAPCEGHSTIWRWCEALPDALESVVTFPGCSGRIAVTNGAVWNLRGAEGQRYPLDGSAPTTYEYGAKAVGWGGDGAGRLLELRWEQGQLRTHVMDNGAR